jgi:hypothetical protein
MNDDSLNTTKEENITIQFHQPLELIIDSSTQNTSNNTYKKVSNDLLDSVRSVKSASEQGQENNQNNENHSMVYKSNIKDKSPLKLGSLYCFLYLKGHPVFTLGPQCILYFKYYILIYSYSLHVIYINSFLSNTKLLV